MTRQASGYDVAVIGAGPQGLMYASWLKKMHPNLGVLVLDREQSPGHKIGESTLSGVCKALRTLGIRHEAMQRLFFTKNGLGFLYADGVNDDLTRAPEYIVEAFDETFQVERRVLDGLILANARRLGVDVTQGARVLPGDSSFSAQGCELSYELDHVEYRVRARLVADASGPASVLGRHFGGYLGEGRTFQTGAAWGYFRNVKWLEQHEGWSRRAASPRDEYTQHVCFREGWMWYIPIVSWQAATDERLTRMLQYLADPNAPVPSRDELSRTFECPYEQIWSIGISLRDDRDTWLKKGAKAAFEHYAQNVPIIRRILEGAELIDGHYPHHHPYAMRARIRRRAAQVAGDGWVLVGDAAFFVDPLISPGLTGGAATAYHAAIESLEALERDDLSRHAFSRYERYVSLLSETLERGNEMDYMAFNHPEAIEIIRRHNELTARKHFNLYCDRPYSIDDTNMWGSLWPDYQERQKAAWQIMREEEELVAGQVRVADQTAQDYERMVRRLRQLLGPHLAENVGLTPYIIRNAGAATAE